MQFQVVRDTIDGTNRRDLIFYLKDGLRSVRYHGIKDHQIIEKDGNDLEQGAFYTVLAVKVTGSVPAHTGGAGYYRRAYLWMLDGARGSYTTVFRDLIDELMVPGCLGTTCFIGKLWVKKNEL